MRALLEMNPHKSVDSLGQAAKTNHAVNFQNINSSGPSAVAATAEPSYLAFQSIPASDDTSSHVVTEIVAEFDVIDRRLLSMETAAELFEAFKVHFASKNHSLIFPNDYTVLQLRREMPVLFLAILATSSGMMRPDLHSTLNTEVIRKYANLLWIGGENSVHLVQAMSITAAWYLPIGEWAGLKFYEYVHFASTMAMDIGLGECEPKSRKSASKADDSFFMGRGIYLEDAISADDRLIFERHRTLLVCYVNCVW